VLNYVQPVATFLITYWSSWYYQGKGHEFQFLEDTCTDKTYRIQRNTEYSSPAESIH